MQAAFGVGSDGSIMNNLENSSRLWQAVTEDGRTETNLISISQGVALVGDSLFIHPGAAGATFVINPIGIAFQNDACMEA